MTGTLTSIYCIGFLITMAGGFLFQNLVAEKDGVNFPTWKVMWLSVIWFITWIVVFWEIYKANRDGA
jgi:hypothetical protein